MIAAASGPLTGGAIAGVIAIVLITLACVGWCVAWWLGSDYDRLHFVVAGVVALVVSWAVWLWAMWPLAYDYHHWIPVQGNIEKISKRLVSDGDKGMSQRYVVVIHEQPYGVDDTRASLLKAGDNVSLACKREFEWGVPREANGWACRWRGVSR